MSTKQQFEQFKGRLEQLGEFDMLPVAKIASELNNIIHPIHQQVLGAFLVSEEVYKPDATRQKLLSIIDECLAAENN